MQLNYIINGEKFKLVETSNKQIKVYAYSKTKWSSGMTFIGIYKNEQDAKTAANKYSV